MTPRLALRLHDIREETGLTQDQLTERIVALAKTRGVKVGKLNQRRWSKYEKAENMPGTDLLLLFAEVTGANEHELYALHAEWQKAETNEARRVARAGKAAQETMQQFVDTYSSFHAAYQSMGVELDRQGREIDRHGQLLDELLEAVVELKEMVLRENGPPDGARR